MSPIRNAPYRHAAVSHLQGHLDEHEEFLNADPNPLPLDLLANRGSLLLSETAKQLTHDTQCKLTTNAQKGCLLYMRVCLCVCICLSVFVFVCVYMLGCMRVRVGVCGYLQGLHQVFSSGDVGDVDGGAKGVQHLHLLEDVLTAGGADDQQLTTL